MAQDLMNYQDMVQDALRSVVKLALEKIINDGLPGEHHFYIEFKTDAEGVEIPASLREQYPNEMTIVIQHQFWDLHIDVDYFSLKLNFSQTPATVKVPYAALTGFFDPSVQFGLQFQNKKGEEETALRRPVEMAPTNDVAPEASVKEAAPAGEDENASENAAEGRENKSAEIVNLDTFRKK